jgi:hypothetical protein
MSPNQRATTALVFCGLSTLLGCNALLDNAPRTAQCDSQDDANVDDAARSARAECSDADPRNFISPGAGGNGSATEAGASVDGAGGSDSGTAEAAGAISDSGLGAFDSGAESGGMADASATDGSAIAEVGPPPCSGWGVNSNCNDGFNCASGACVRAPVSCASQRSSYAASPDGVYWLNPTGAAQLRAYCDMRQGVELCTDVQGDHQSRTREGSNSSFAMISLLLWNEGVCKIWALRRTPEGYPFSKLVLQHALGTCQAFGFVADDEIGYCPYGDNAGKTNCGFPLGTVAPPPYYAMRDSCLGCTEAGDGDHDSYVVSGPMHFTDTLSSFDGSTYTRCRVR